MEARNGTKGSGTSKNIYYEEKLLLGVVRVFSKKTFAKSLCIRTIYFGADWSGLIQSLTPQLHLVSIGWSFAELVGSLVGWVPVIIPITNLTSKNNSWQNTDWQWWSYRLTIFPALYPTQTWYLYQFEGAGNNGGLGWTWNCLQRPNGKSSWEHFVVLPCDDCNGSIHWFVMWNIHL